MMYQLLFVLLFVFIPNLVTSQSNVTIGKWTHIYDPSIGESGKWYINDHTFIKDRNGTWHLFGITHPEPASPENEILFAHATAKNLLGPWTKQAPALKINTSYFGEAHLWAPHVLDLNDSYHMFYSGGGSDRSQSAINLATSKDLFHWERLPSGPLFRDGFEARDPMVRQYNNLAVMFYTATSKPTGGNHVVAYRFSTDFKHWTDRKIAFVDPEVGTGAGPTESPFVVYVNGLFYLFIGPRGNYRGTTVFKSKDPLNFDFNKQAGQIYAHASEVIYDNNQWWISHCGWGQNGVFLAPLYFPH